MEQKKMSRENFWSSSGSVSEEKEIYQKETEIIKEAELSYGDGFLTLICC